MSLALAALVTALSPALAAPVEDAADALRDQAWADSLDATEYAASPYASPADLPATIEIETSYQAFNDYYYFALVDGRIYYKPRYKRPAGAPEWRTDLEWRPFGVNGGLPYRLDARNPADIDTVYTDGDRQAFVRDLTYQTASEDDLASIRAAEGGDWAAASQWSGQAELDSEFPVPERILAITADDDEIAALGSNRQMYYRRRFANIFVSTEWYVGWGQAKEQEVFFPSHLTGHRGWSLGRITAFGAGYKEGPDGRIFEWGPAAVSMETMVWLSPDGRIIYYLDSGTPPEVVHFVEPPFRGVWRGEAINSSASTIMLLDRFGAVQTKIADFDLLGSTPTHPYCYFEECDDEPFYPPGDIRSGMADIRLPPEGWLIHEPVLPPEAWSEETRLSRRISVLSTGKGNAGREMRIVALQEGVLGYYHKGLGEDSWSFRPAPEGDRGFDLAPEEWLELEDLRAYSAPEDLEAMHAAEPTIDQPLTGKLELSKGALVDLEIGDFNLQSSPWQVTLRVREVELPMELHLVQAWNPYMPPHYGEAQHSQKIVTYEGTLAFDQAELERLLAPEVNSDEGRAIRKLLDEARNAKFALVVNANEHGVELHTKREKLTGGPLQGYALSGEIPPADQEKLRSWADRFWATQEEHMGWLDDVAALSERTPEAAICEAGAVEWAAEVRLLEAEMDAGVKGLRQVKRESRRFSRSIFLTSGFMYASGLKWLDHVLDVTRADRSDAVRPNELRFNVITGITSRIPFLAKNISQIEAERLGYAKAERAEVQSWLAPLDEQASAIEKACR